MGNCGLLFTVVTWCGKLKALRAEIPTRTHCESPLRCGRVGKHSMVHQESSHLREALEGSCCPPVGRIGHRFAHCPIWAALDPSRADLVGLFVVIRPVPRVGEVVDSRGSGRLWKHVVVCNREVDQPAPAAAGLGLSTCKLWVIGRHAQYIVIRISSSCPHCEPGTPGTQSSGRICSDLYGGLAPHFGHVSGVLTPKSVYLT